MRIIEYEPRKIVNNEEYLRVIIYYCKLNLCLLNSEGFKPELKLMRDYLITNVNRGIQTYDRC